MSEILSPFPTRPIMVRGLGDAVQALLAGREAGLPVVLASAPAAGCHAGGGWFAALVESVRARVPGVAVTAVLDCADQPGAALGALRAGVRDVSLLAPPDTFARVGAIAAAKGARLHPPMEGVLDLRGRPDAAGACRSWLVGTP
jgi:hypothetical protein